MTKPSSLSRVARREQFLQGLRHLCAKQAAGQTFTNAEIAKACGCTGQYIGQIADKALDTLYRRLCREARRAGLSVPRRKQPCN